MPKYNLTLWLRLPGEFQKVNSIDGVEAKSGFHAACIWAKTLGIPDKLWFDDQPAHLNTPTRFVIRNDTPEAA